MHKQKNAIIDEFVNNMATCLVSTTHERLIKHSREYGWELHALPGTNIESVVILKKSQDAFPEIWVRWCYTNYRRAFGIYLQQWHNLQNVRIPYQLQVDHLQPTHRFKNGDPNYFIRLCLLDRKTNSSYGAGFEKSFNKEERNKPPIGGIHMDWMAFLKAYGILLPSKTSSPEEWKEWAYETAALMEQENIEDRIQAFYGILGVLQLGFTGYYSGSQNAGPWKIPAE